jgi:hypothetical protein
MVRVSIHSIPGFLAIHPNDVIAWSSGRTTARTMEAVTAIAELGPNSALQASA